MQKKGDIPQDHNNLVVKALELVRKARHVTQGVDVVLIKRIPSCAGLGGGSSDAATAMMMADRFWNLKLSPREYMELGAELGSDVPLFFTPGYSLGTGRGEVVRPVKSALRLDVVIVKPSCGIKTKDAFDRLDQAHGQDYPMASESLLQAIENQNPFRVGQNLWNRLESVAGAIHPELETIRAFLAKQDCPGVLMSGSGTACYGICRNRNHAGHVASRMRSLDLGSVFLTHTFLGVKRCFLSRKSEPGVSLD